MGAPGPMPGSPAISTRVMWAGRIVSGWAVVLFVADGVMKAVASPVAVQATVRQLGYPEADVVGIGVLLLACTLLYVVPRTSILGAILLTGYLGGAVASQVRVGAAPFNVAFAVVFGALVWAGLWLRDTRVRALLSWNGTSAPALENRRSP